MHFSIRLKQLRENKGLSQEELASRLNIPRSSITHYENNSDRLPRRSRLLEIANFFNVTVDYLINESVTEKESSNSLPTLTSKDEKDVAKDLEKALADLSSDEALMFDGEPMDDETKELVRISLENSLRMAKQLAKQKFTPKKYQDE